MEKEELLRQLVGKTIAEANIVEDKDEFKIISIFTTDGFLFELDKRNITHPAYDKDMEKFIAKLNEAKCDSVFTFRTDEISIEEMRKIVLEKAGKLKCNGGSVTGHFTSDYKIRFGENLSNVNKSY